MRYKLGFDIGYDEIHWELDTFYEDRDNFYKKMLIIFGKEKGYIEDARIVFPNSHRKLANELIKIVEDNGFLYTIGTVPEYYPEEIAAARYVPFLIEGEELDHDACGEPFNKYKIIHCGTCGRPDFKKVPHPYLIDTKYMKKRQKFHHVSGDLAIFSNEAFNKLKDDIGDWVDTGAVSVTEKGKVINETNFIWVRPKCKIGSFTNAIVKQKCKTCKHPIEIREVRSEDSFEMNKHVVESFLDVTAPIVLAGNWYGEVTPGGHCQQFTYMFISGQLHEKIKKMKLKGFCEAKYIIHAADEEEFTD